MTTSIKDAAHELEAVLLRQLLAETKAFRGGESAGSHVYGDFFVDALADAVEKSGGLGLAGVIERSLTPAHARASSGVQASLGAAGGFGGVPASLGAAGGSGGVQASLGAAGGSGGVQGSLGASGDLNGVPHSSPLSLASTSSSAAAAATLEELVIGADPHDHARVSSGFGARRDPIHGRHSFHGGVDIAAPAGTPIHALRDGVVTFAGERGGYGYVVEVDHGDGLVTRYAHASKLHARTGDHVRAGAHIADVGSTGRSTGAHVHVEALREGARIDPARAGLLRRDPNGESD